MFPVCGDNPSVCLVHLDDCSVCQLETRAAIVSDLGLLVLLLIVKRSKTLDFGLPRFYSVAT